MVVTGAALVQAPSPQPSPARGEGVMPNAAAGAQVGVPIGDMYLFKMNWLLAIER